MNINIITLFPELILPYTQFGLIAKAAEEGILHVNIVDLRDFGEGNHKSIDDYPYGGGSGMIMMANPLKNALLSVKHPGCSILTSPSGIMLNQSLIEDRLMRNDDITIIAGRYKAADQRFIERYIDLEISVGDYVLQGGELPALIILESVSRLIGGFMNDMDSAKTDSFSCGLLDYPQYTRPDMFENISVPDILLSGHHDKIRKWRLEQSLRKTLKNRPDLIENKDLTNEEKKIINIIETEDKNG